MRWSLVVAVSVLHAYVPFSPPPVVNAPLLVIPHAPTVTSVVPLGLIASPEVAPKPSGERSRFDPLAAIPTPRKAGFFVHLVTIPFCVPASALPASKIATYWLFAASSQMTKRWPAPPVPPPVLHQTAAKPPRLFPSVASGPAWQYGSGVQT